MAAQLDMFGARPKCLDRTPPWFSGHWRDYHRGHGCDKDPGPEIQRRRASPPRKLSIDARFAVFHEANPHVAAEMLRLARARLDRGETRIAVKALWEELRASLEVIAEGGLGGTEGPYRLNNDFTSLYARTLIRLEPKLREVIELRARKARK